MTPGFKALQPFSTNKVRFASPTSKSRKKTTTKRKRNARGAQSKIYFPYISRTRLLCNLTLYNNWLYLSLSLLFERRRVRTCSISRAHCACKSERVCNKEKIIAYRPGDDSHSRQREGVTALVCISETHYGAQARASEPLFLLSICPFFFLGPTRRLSRASV